MKDKFFDYVAKGVFFVLIFTFFAFFTIGVEWCLTKIGVPIVMSQEIVELALCLAVTLAVMSCIED